MFTKTYKILYAHDDVEIIASMTQMCEWALLGTIHLVNQKCLCIKWSDYFRYPIHSPIIAKLSLTSMCTCLEILYKPSLEWSCWLAFDYDCSYHCNLPFVCQFKFLCLVYCLSLSSSIPTIG